MDHRAKAVNPAGKPKAVGFNYDKLQAAACMAASAAVSIALITWAIKTFF
jgi:hypothetical protein